MPGRKVPVTSCATLSSCASLPLVHASCSEHWPPMTAIAVLALWVSGQLLQTAPHCCFAAHSKQALAHSSLHLLTGSQVLINREGWVKELHSSCTLLALPPLPMLPHDCAAAWGPERCQGLSILSKRGVKALKLKPRVAEAVAAD